MLVQAFLIGSAFLYAGYYLGFLVKKPRVHCNERQLLFLQRHVPILFHTFWPTFFCLGGFLQTIFRDAFVCKKHITFIRELLTYPDGEVVAVDWADKFYVKSQRDDSERESVREEDESRPIVILLPGLVGTNRDNYCKRILYQCAQRGFRGVVLNYRGSAGMKLITSSMYNAANTNDLDHAVGWLHHHHPHAPLMTVGFSLGGIIIFNYLARKEACNKSLLTCGMSISIGWDLISSNQNLLLFPQSLIFNKPLTAYMIKLALKHKDKFEKVVNMEAVKQSKSIREFDDNFTRRISGYNTVNEYYHAGSPYYKVHDMEVPCLNLNAQDDPFSPLSNIPTAAATSSDNVTIATTRVGGHMGFVDALWGGRDGGFYEAVFGEYASAMFQHANKRL